jgi:uncharacterized membrane protein
MDVHRNVLTQSTVTIALAMMDTDWQLTAKIVKILMNVSKLILVFSCVTTQRALSHAAVKLVMLKMVKQDVWLAITVHSSCLPTELTSANIN